MNKRKNYFIDKKFQTNFILKFCLLATATGLLIIGALYFLTKKATTVSFVNSRVVVQTTADFIFPVLIQTVIVATIIVSIATVFFTLFISHRIAGPAYRFKKILRSLSEGDFSGECRIRRTDSLQDVSSAINDMIVNVRQGLKSMDASLADLKGRMEKGSGADELKKGLSELHRALHHFKF